jgi:hypothetical protein
MGKVLSLREAKNAAEGFIVANGARVKPLHGEVMIEIDEPASLQIKLTVEHARIWAHALLKVANAVERKVGRK